MVTPKDVRDSFPCLRTSRIVTEGGSLRKAEKTGFDENVATQSVQWYTSSHGREVTGFWPACRLRYGDTDSKIGGFVQGVESTRDGEEEELLCRYYVFSSLLRRSLKEGLVS